MAQLLPEINIHLVLSLQLCLVVNCVTFDSVLDTSLLKVSDHVVICKAEADMAMRKAARLSSLKAPLYAIYSTSLTLHCNLAVSSIKKRVNILFHLQVPPCSNAQHKHAIEKPGSLAEAIHMT